ncbi:MAG: hypothetical protein LBV23_05980, partial [Deltaproteobacteria bacterium]|nr:hypothetical protein [Deltaproteobacteria bacterium]
MFGDTRYYLRKRSNNKDDGLSVGSTWETLGFALAKFKKLAPRDRYAVIDIGDGNCDEDTGKGSVIYINSPLNAWLIIEGSRPNTIINGSSLTKGDFVECAPGVVTLTLISRSFILLQGALMPIIWTYTKNKATYAEVRTSERKGK